MSILLSKKHSEDISISMQLCWTKESQGKISSEVRTVGGSDRGRTTEIGGCDQPSAGPIAN
jgi:hypothetical protein